MTPYEKTAQLKEQVTHGTRDFPLGFYEVTPEDSWKGFQHHWHEEIEILFFSQGKGSVEINMESIPLEKDTFYFINSGGLHSMTARGPCQESAVLFHPRMLCFDAYDMAQSRLIQPLLTGSLSFPRTLSPEHRAFSALKEEYDRLSGMCRTFKPTMSTDVTAQLFIKAGLLRILGILYAHQLLDAGLPDNYKEQAVKKVLSYIRSHYQDTIRIQELADQISLNPQYFCRFFKAAIGQSPISYINEYRIRQSMMMLKNTSQTATDIGLLCGFSSFSSFCKAFKEQTGLTPLKYRQSVQNSHRASCQN